MRIYLAPMEGVVDHHLRKLYSDIGGFDLCVTEFIRVTDHVLPRKVFYRLAPEIDPARPNEGSSVPTKIQLLGSNPHALAENAAKAATLGAYGIDLNFGCPAKTVNRHRGGACLLQEPETLHAIVREVRRAVPAETPVTAKIRLGFNDREHYLENARAIADAGADELVVHARTKADGYRPPAYWHCIAEICAAVSVPVIANGDIWSVSDYHRCRSESRCDSVMLGRGAMARPDLALAIRASVSGETYEAMSWPEVAGLVLQFFTTTAVQYPKKYLGNRVKQWLFYLSREYPEAANTFANIKRCREYPVLRNALSAEAELNTVSESRARA